MNFQMQQRICVACTEGKLDVRTEPREIALAQIPVPFSGLGVRDRVSLGAAVRA